VRGRQCRRTNGFGCASGRENDLVYWSTDAIAAPERFAFWREVVCNTVFNVTTEAPAANFSARITARSFGDFRFASFSSTGYEIEHTRQHARQLPDDSYLVSLQVQGRSLITQGEDRVILGPNEIGIVDGRKPFHIGFPEDVGRIVAVLPRALVDQRAPWLKSGQLRKLGAAAPFADLARQHLVHLGSGEMAAAGEAAAAMLGENLANLLALGSAPVAEPGRLHPDVQLEALLTFCRRHLGDADLTPQLAAGALGMSVRTLHNRFATLGQSFGRWLLQSRLEAASAALRESRQRGTPISEIAYRAGFNDLSHFNRSFRARFGVSPGQWRADG
jgi:AraC family transcriptional activator of tynA and feaB